MLLFINLSPQTLDLDAARNDWVRPAVEAAGLLAVAGRDRGDRAFRGTHRRGREVLQRLRKQGFQIALDNVGTGNSGLEMLRKVDADFVKLDPSIVIAAPTDPSARAVLLAMATFARQTGSFVIAEGMEDDDTLQFLRGIDMRDLHIDTIIQGGQGGELGSPSLSHAAGCSGSAAR